MLKPALCAARLYNVDLRSLWARGIRLLLIDADNTLSTWQNSDVSPENLAWIRAAQDMGFALLIVSNAGAERLAPLERALAIKAVPSCAKPLPFKVSAARRRLGFEKAACAMLGDQLLTDVLAANLAGLHSVLLSPIDVSREFAGTRINRKIEGVLKRMLKLP